MDTDRITGLINSNDFLVKGNEIIQKADKRYAFITSDLSNFKYINEIYGTAEGDSLIKMMADFFYINNPNCILACRTGGEQFRAIIDLHGLSPEEEIQYITARNLEFEKILAEKYPNVFLHMYTGIYVIENSSVTIRQAIDCAHQAKKTIKGNFNISCKMYQEENFKVYRRNMELINEFNQACNNDGILLYLQPKFSASANNIIGAEALVRILASNHTIIPPGEFIPLLESTGMIGKLDDIIMEKVFSTLRKWLDRNVHVYPISINVSRVRFSKPDFIEKVLSLQQIYQIPPELIELEVTETTLIGSLDYMQTYLNTLRTQGFRISVDDFGSGYSSLNQIATIPADIIKLDCAFAKECLKTSKGQSVVSSVISMLNKIDYDIICEGIETKEQLDLITSLGCDKIQGFYYDKPMPLIQFENKYIK